MRIYFLQSIYYENKGAPSSVTEVQRCAIFKVTTFYMPAHVQGLVSEVKMTTVLEEYTTEEQRSAVRFTFCAKGLNAKDIHNKVFLV
jgi:hypothetical protein